MAAIFNVNLVKKYKKVNGINKLKEKKDEVNKDVA